MPFRVSVEGIPSAQHTDYKNIYNRLKTDFYFALGVEKPWPLDDYVLVKYKHMEGTFT